MGKTKSARLARMINYKFTITYRLFFMLVALGLITLTTSCTSQKENVEQEPEYLTYSNDAYKFSVEYPASWDNSQEKLEDKWAITDSQKNAVLFIAGRADGIVSLEDVGFAQMKQDSDGSGEDDESLRRALRLINVSGTSWYTYALEYKDKELESIVSGSLCGDSHIIIILVANKESLNATKETYINILQSFRCNAVD